MRLFTALLGLLAVACAGGHSVRVELRTDYVPGVEFAEVAVPLRVGDDRTLGPLVRAAAAGDDFSTPRWWSRST